jgi:hypothetical protein
MPSLVIGLPVMRGQLESEFFHSLFAARRHLYEHGIPHNVLSNECSLISASRDTIAEQYIKATKSEYFMWIDSDIQFPVYGITRLVQRDLDIVGGVYYHKDAGASPTVYKFTDDEKFRCYGEFNILNNVFECDGIGTGFLMMKRKVLEAFTPEVTKELGTPFQMGIAPDGLQEGEDLSFCRRAKKLGFKIYADPTIPLVHIGRTGYTRENYISAMQFAKWKDSVEQYNNEIPGWMTRTELNWLAKTASVMDTIVEVGSWKGRSTHALLTGCKGKVYAVDHFKGTPGETDGPHAEALEKDIHAIFMENVGHFSNLEVMKMDSAEAASKFEDGSVDMVFLDGAHDYEGLKKDIDAWLPKAKKMICGHDWQLHTVQEAVTEKFGEPDTADSIWLFTIGDFHRNTANSPAEAKSIFIRP